MRGEMREKSRLIKGELGGKLEENEGK